MSLRGLDLGLVVRGWLSAGWMPDLQVVRDAEAASHSDQIDALTLIVLAWLRHVALVITTEPPGLVNPVWISRNVRPVVRAWTASIEGDAVR
jgi:hypothetical protein